MFGTGPSRSPPPAWFITALDETDRADSLGCLTQVLDRVARGLGFEGVSHVDADDISARPRFRSTMPEAWQRNSISRGFKDQDPVILAARRRATGYSWAEVPGGRAVGGPRVP